MEKSSDELSRLAQTLAGPNGVARSTHSMFFKKFTNSFLGSDAVSFLMKTGLSRLAALDLAQKLLEKGFIVCLVSQSGKFAEANVFRFREDEASPTKALSSSGAGSGGGTVLHISLADGSEKRVDFGLNVNVRACVKQLAASLEMTFGIEEWSLGSKSGWLNNDLLVSDQWSMSDGPLRFRKKYFLTDSQLPAQCKERTLLFYQLRTAVVNNVVICTPAQLIKLAALAAQEQLQDRDPGKHTRVDLRPFLPESSWPNCEVPALEAWNGLRGRQRGEAVFEFTELLIKEVPTFGIYRFPVVEPGAKDKAKRDLGITSANLFRIADNVVVEQMRLEDLRTWNFTPKSIELEFLGAKRDKYVASTTRGREILALLSEYQYFNRTRGGVSDTVKVHLMLRASDAASAPKQCQVDISKTSREVISELLKTFSAEDKSAVDPSKAAFFSLRTASRWLSSDEKLGGLRESELWLEPRTDLHQAAEDGDVARGTALLANGCPINAPDLHGNSALHIAVRKEQKLFMLLLLSHPNVDVNAVNLLSEPAIDQVLNLSNSGIKQLPSSIAKCTSLTKRLDLSSNSLMTIPQEFRNLKVQELLLAGNPLPGIPPSVIAAGSSEVLSFLRDAGLVSDWKRCKAVFCGPEGAGRSDLIKLLSKKNGSSPRGSSRAGLVIADVKLGDAELCCFDVTGSEWFERTEAILYSKRSIFCLVFSWKDLDVKQVVSRIQRIDAAQEGHAPMVLFMTQSALVEDSVRSVRAGELTSALQPFAQRLSTSNASLFVNVNLADESSATLAASSALKTRFAALDAKEMQVPRSFQCLHVFLQSLLPGPTPLALQPSMGTKVFVSPVHSHVASQSWGKPTRLPGVISREEFHQYASDAFVGKEHYENAAKHLVEIGSILRVGQWVVLDVPSFVQRLRDVLALQGTTLDGIVPFSVLRTLWSDVASGLLPQLVSLLEACNLATSFPDRSFLFVPSLVLPQKVAPSWSAAVFVPRYVSEWRCSAAGASFPDLFRFRLLSHLSRRASFERVWALGALLATIDDTVRVKVEFVCAADSLIVTKLVMTVSSKKPVEGVLGYWIELISSVVDAALQDHAALKLERFVRALSLPKPALIRYNDLLEFRRKGNKVVAVQGTNVALDVLLPAAPALPGSEPNVPPSSWIEAASEGHLVWSLNVCAECMVAVAEALSSTEEVVLPEQDHDLAIFHAIEKFSVQSSSRVSEFVVCRDSLIEAARGVVSVLRAGVMQAGNRVLLEEHVARLVELVGMIHCAELGTPLDEPSSALLRAVALKFRGACNLVISNKSVAGSSNVRGGVAAGDPSGKGRLLSLRVSRLQSVISMAVTIEAGVMLGRACAMLGSLAAELAKVGGGGGGDSLAASQKLVDAVLASLHEGCTGRSSVLFLSRLGSLPAQLDSSIESVWKVSQKAVETERALSRVVEHNSHLAPVIDPIRKHLVVRVEDTLFERLVSIHRAAALCGQSPTPEFMAAGGGSLAVAVDLAKLAAADLASLSRFVVEGAASDATLQALTSQLDKSLLVVLDQLNASEVASVRKVLGDQKPFWNKFVDACKKSLPATTAMSACVGRAFSSLTELWVALGEQSAIAHDEYDAILDGLEDALLELRIGVPALSLFRSPDWDGACKEMDVALDGLERAKLISSCKRLCSLVQVIALTGGGPCAVPLVETAIKLVSSLAQLDSLLFEAGFDAKSSFSVSVLAAEAKASVGLMRRTVQGKWAVMEVSIGKSAHREVSAVLAVSIVSDLRNLHGAVRSVTVSPLSARGNGFKVMQQLAERVLGNLQVVVASGLRETSGLKEKVAELQVCLTKFGSDTGHAMRWTSAKNVLRSVLSVRDCLLNAEQVKASLGLLEATWGCGGNSTGGMAVDEVSTALLENPLELTRQLESATGELSVAATKSPLDLAQKLHALVSLVASVASALRKNVIGPVKRCFAAYAPVYSAASGRGKYAIKFGNSGERILVLAEAVSLLCEGLESQTDDEAAVAGRKGMMGVRDALGAFAETPMQSDAVFATASTALYTALVHVPVVKSDFARVSLLVDVGHCLQKLGAAVSAVLINFDNLAMQTKLTKRRNRVVSVLQDLVADLKRQQDQTQPQQSQQQQVVSETGASGGSSSPRFPSSPQTTSPRNESSGQLVKSPRKLTIADSGNKSPRSEEPKRSPRGTVDGKSNARDSTAEAKKSPRFSMPKSPRNDEVSKSPPDAEPKKSPRFSVAKNDDLSKSPPDAETKKSPRFSTPKSPRVDEPAKSPREEPGKKSPRVGEAARPSEPSFKPSVPPIAVEAVAAASSPGSRVSQVLISSPKAATKCKGVFKFQAKSERELSFQRGDEIELDPTVDASVAGTWRGRIAGTNGPFLEFPSKYTKLV